MNTPPQNARILVVDDDPELRVMLRDYLTGNGYTVDLAAHGDAMRESLAQAMPQAVVLDLMLPGDDGLTLARELRRSSDVPILMLSARGEEIDRVIGLEVGADDYLPKPFSPRELLARLRALLRRAQAGDQGDGGPHQVSLALVGSGPGAESARGVTRFGPFFLDTAAFRLLRDGQDVGLSVAEFTLLQAMAARPNRVLSRDQLIDWLKGYERDAFDRSIDVRVTRLRRKIEADPAHPVYIRTIRGQGYLFNPAGAGN
jgi:two-component system phosphate regulon response regulator OmpR